MIDEMPGTQGISVAINRRRRRPLAVIQDASLSHEGGERPLDPGMGDVEVLAARRYVRVIRGVKPNITVTYLSLDHQSPGTGLAADPLVWTDTSLDC